ncbi:MAG: hypothetical protein R3F19_18515 [Verrucomicrobiales bacterium]
MNQHHPYLQRMENREIQQDIREIARCYDRPINSHNKNAPAELGHMLQNFVDHQSASSFKVTE